MVDMPANVGQDDGDDRLMGHCPSRLMPDMNGDGRIVTVGGVDRVQYGYEPWNQVIKMVGIGNEPTFSSLEYLIYRRLCRVRTYKYIVGLLRNIECDEHRGSLPSSAW